jgi:hypothetical protein
MPKYVGFFNAGPLENPLLVGIDARQRIARLP